MIPCADGQPCGDVHAETEHEHSDQDTESEHHHCSSICACFCCGTIYNLPQQLDIQFDPIPKIGQKQLFCHDLYVFTYLYEIWHPPC